MTSLTTLLQDKIDEIFFKHPAVTANNEVCTMVTRGELNKGFSQTLHLLIDHLIQKEEGEKDLKKYPTPHWPEGTQIEADGYNAAKDETIAYLKELKEKIQ